MQRAAEASGAHHSAAVWAGWVLWSYIAWASVTSLRTTKHLAYSAEKGLHHG